MKIIIEQKPATKECCQVSVDDRSITVQGLDETTTLVRMILRGELVLEEPAFPQGDRDD